MLVLKLRTGETNLAICKFRDLKDKYHSVNQQFDIRLSNYVTMAIL